MDGLREALEPRVWNPDESNLPWFGKSPGLFFLKSLFCCRPERNRNYFILLYSFNQLASVVDLEQAEMSKFKFNQAVEMTT